MRHQLRPALEEVIDLGHPLVRLAQQIDWGFLDRRSSSACKNRRRPAALADPAGGWAVDPQACTACSDEALRARWLENPYYQFFCGELSFCHKLPFDRSSLTNPCAGCPWLRHRVPPLPNTPASDRLVCQCRLCRCCHFVQPPPIPKEWNRERGVVIRGVGGRRRGAGVLPLPPFCWNSVARHCAISCAWLRNHLGRVEPHQLGRVDPTFAVPDREPEPAGGHRAMDRGPVSAAEPRRLLQPNDARGRSGSLAAISATAAGDAANSAAAQRAIACSNR
jgi:hypothetical protein